MKLGQIAKKSIITRAAIVAFIMRNSRSTQAEIARAVNLTRPTVVKHLLALVEASAIVNVAGKYFAP